MEGIDGNFLLSPCLKTTFADFGQNSMIFLVVRKNAL